MKRGRGAVGVQIFSTLILILNSISQRIYFKLANKVNKFTWKFQTFLNILSPERFSTYDYGSNFKNEAETFLLKNLYLIDRLDINLPKLGLQHQISFTPSIACILTVFNQNRDILYRSFQSTIAQTQGFSEVIIIDSASTNVETIEYLNEIERGSFPVRVTLIREESDQGVIHARNKGSKASTSDFIVFLDPDDWFEPQYASEIYLALNHFPTADIVYPNAKVVNLETGSENFWFTGPFSFRHLFSNNRIPISSAIKRTFFHSIGGFREQVQRGPEDWDLWLRAAISGARAIHVSKAIFVNTGVKDGGRTAANAQFAEEEKIKLQKFALTQLLSQSKRHLWPTH